MKFKSLAKKAKEWNLTSEEITSLEALIKENQHMIKTMNINLLNFNSYDELLNVIDNLNLIKENNLVNKLLPRELKPFKTEKVSNLIKVILDYKDEDFLKALLVKHRHEIQSSIELEKLIFNEYEIIIKSSKSFIREIIKNDNDIQKILFDDKFSIVKIKTYKALIEVVKSKVWCISRRESTFNNYQRNYGDFFLIINHDLNANDKNYLIGLNVDKNEEGEVDFTKSFDNENDSLNEKDVQNILGERYNKIIENVTPSMKKKTQNEWEAAILDRLRRSIDNINGNGKTRQKEFYYIKKQEDEIKNLMQRKYDKEASRKLKLDREIEEVRQKMDKEIRSVKKAEENIANDIAIQKENNYFKVMKERQPLDIMKMDDEELSKMFHVNYNIIKDS